MLEASHFKHQNSLYEENTALNDSSLITGEPEHFLKCLMALGCVREICLSIYLLEY